MDTNLKIEQKIYLEADRNEVWDALVNPLKIKQYLFGTETTSQWKKGSEIVFTGEYEGTTYRDSGVILEFLPGEKLQYTYWSSFSKTENTPENHSVITFQLNTFGEGTELVIQQQGFPDLAAQQHSLSSWDMVLNGIKEIVEKENA